MKRVFLLVTAAFVVSILPFSDLRAADAPKLEGDWSGSLKVTDDVSLRIVFHIKKAADGTYNATWDSPDQGARGLKVDTLKYEDATVLLTGKSAGIEYVGKVQADGKAIDGKFSQRGKTIDMKLTPAEPDAKPDLIYEGKLKAATGIEVRVVINLYKQKDGSFKATMDSPDENITGLKIDPFTMDKDKFAFKIPLARAEYVGKINETKTEVEGTWSQLGKKLPLTLKKTDKVAQINRPQVPKGPLPYEEVAVSYDNKEGKNRLAGTLTLPKKPGPFPAVVLISGSGAQDRDETLMGHKPFLILADYLTRRGIAVLRFDDRGVGSSTGDHNAATSADFATDVQAGIDFLKTRKEIDGKKIGLMGHSEGGLIAPMVAAKRPAEVAFVVLLAGPGVPGDEILVAQSMLIQKAMGAPADSIAKNTEAAKSLYQLMRSNQDAATLKTSLDAFVADRIKRLTDEEKKELGDNPGDVMQGQLKILQTPWFRYFLTYDPRPTLEKVKCPVLAINGEKDLQVPPSQNLPEIAKALKTGGNSRVTIKELPGLNHLFQTCKTGSPAEYSQIEETISPAALQVIGDWIVDLK